MVPISMTGCIATAICLCSFTAISADISVGFGPPETTREWVEYKIPLIADTFGVSQTVFTEALSHIKSFMIKAEMSTKPDTASIDSVRVGSAFLSTFDSGVEGWTIHNDATMKWESAGGRNGAFITLLDWSTGSYFRAVSPPEWGGDWRDLEGDTIAFFIRVNHNIRPGAVILATGSADRLFFAIKGNPAVVQGDSIELTIGIDPAPQSPLRITFSSSEKTCIDLPNMVTVSAGATSASVMVKAAESSAGCESVVQASASGYAAARISLTSVEMLVARNASSSTMAYGGNVRVFRDASGTPFLMLPENASGLVSIHSLSGRIVARHRTVNAKAPVALSGLSCGMYIARLSLGGVEKCVSFCIDR
jgi:hypothetical protein